MSLVFGLGWEGVEPMPRGLINPGRLPFFHPGQIPQRVAWPGPVPTSLSLDLLESVLRHVGLSEVHRAVALLLETLGPPPSGLHLQRYGAPIWAVAGLCQALHCFLSLMPSCLHSRGIYREILFLTMAAMGKDHMDIGGRQAGG